MIKLSDIKIGQLFYINYPDDKELLCCCFNNGEYIKAAHIEHDVGYYFDNKGIHRIQLITENIPQLNPNFITKIYKRIIEYNEIKIHSLISLKELLQIREGLV